MYIYSILGGIMLYTGYVNRAKLYQEGINQGWNIVYYYHMTKQHISSILFKIGKYYYLTAEQLLYAFKFLANS